MINTQPASMTTALRSRPTFTPQDPAPAGSEDPVYDLSTLDNAREMYFLPQVDRLAALLASRSGGDMDVKLQIKDQTLEYTTNGKPDQTITASLNGKPFTVAGTPEGEGTYALLGDNPAGIFQCTYYPLDGEGTQVVGLTGATHMPVNHSLSTTAGSDAMEAMGNFACARFHIEYTPDGDKGLHMTGELGKHQIDAYLTSGANGAKLLQGEFGDVHFKQTFTPRQA